MSHCTIPLVFLLFSLETSVVYSGSHTLHYHITKLTASSPGLPDFMHAAYVDGLLSASYNSEVQQCEFWIPALGTMYERMMLQKKFHNDMENSHNQRMKILTDLYNKTSGKDGIHIYQTKSACEVHDDGTIGVYEEVAFDGKELIAYNKHTGTFIPTTPEAQVVAQIWNENYAKMQKIFLENFCTHRLSIFLSAIANDLEKKVQPYGTVSSSGSGSLTVLHCWVYGFYPREVEVKWIKNGRDEIDSEEAPEILPNPDGTYQIRVSVEVTPEEGATYSCHVDHRSLDNPLVVLFESNGMRIYYIMILMAAALFFTFAALGIFVCRKRTRGICCDPPNLQVLGEVETVVLKGNSASH